MSSVKREILLLKVVFFVFAILISRWKDKLQFNFFFLLFLTVAGHANSLLHHQQIFLTTSKSIQRHYLAAPGALHASCPEQPSCITVSKTTQADVFSELLECYCVSREWKMDTKSLLYMT